MQLHDAMVHPNSGTGKARPMDFEAITDQFNHRVVQKWKEDALLVSKYKLKTIPLIKIAYDRAAEHAECARLVGPKLDKLLDLRSHLKSDTGFVFPDILPREEEQSVNVMPPPLLPPSLPPSLPPPAALTSTMVEQNVEPTIDDWNWDPGSKPSMKLINKRLQILDTVACCVRCGKKSATRKSKDGQWDVLNDHFLLKKTGRFFPCPSCPDGEIAEKDQKTRSVEIVRKKKKLNKIITSRKRKRAGGKKK